MADLAWIDVVDTAVKVGAGALASGLATYAVTRLRHDHESKKVVFENKVAILREIVNCAEESTGLMNDFSHNTRSIRIPRDVDKLIEESEKLMSGYKKMGEAQGLSCMIGFKSLSLVIDELCKLFLKLYYLITDKPLELDLSSAQNTISEINSSLERLREEISHAYSDMSL